MASFDPDRRRLVLTHGELAAATVLVTEPAENGSKDLVDLEEARRALEHAGLVVEGSVIPPVAAMVRVISRPQLRLLVEALAEEAVVAHAAWATPDVAVIGRSVAQDTLEYTVTDSVSLPFALAHLVGLGRRPTHPDETIAVDLSTLDEVALALRSGDTGIGSRLEEQAGFSPSQAGTVIGIVANRCLSWRASSMWIDQDGLSHTTALTVIDSGESGLWRSERLEDGGGSLSANRLVLTPLAPSDVWKALVDLLPVRLAARTR